MCWDPRDKIYSVVGILSRMFPETTVSKLIMPDYEIRPYELFIRVTRLILEHLTSLDYISDVRKGSSTAAEREFPSWVVDYSFDRESSSMVKLYAAVGVGLCDNSKYPRFAVSLTTISCYGGNFESIIWVSKFNLVELLQPDHILDLLHVLVLFPQKVNGKNRLEALWRILAMNYDNVDYGLAVPAIEESFVAGFKIRILAFLKSIEYQDSRTDFEYTIRQLGQERPIERSLNEIIEKFQFYTVGGSGHEYE